MLSGGTATIQAQSTLSALPFKKQSKQQSNLQMAGMWSSGARRRKKNKNKITGGRLRFPQIINAACSVLNSTTFAGMAIFPPVDSAD
jgi:hypothetical protein